MRVRVNLYQYQNSLTYDDVRTPERGTSVGVRGFSGETTEEFRRMNKLSTVNPRRPMFVPCSGVLALHRFTKRTVMIFFIWTYIYHR